jgi:molecular chaperone GrpE
MHEKDFENANSDKIDNLENMNPNSAVEPSEQTETALETTETAEKDIKQSKSEMSETSEASEMEELRAKIDAITDQMLRVAAEFENYKKRVRREQTELMKYAGENIIKDLIPILDNFERAINSAKSNSSFDSFYQGVDLIYKQMLDLLKQRGVSQIEAVGKNFDPNLHEAIVHVPSSEYPENTVIEEFQKGFMLNDRVVRPAIVSVSKKVEGDGKESDKQ